MSEADELVVRSEPRPGVVQLTLSRPDKLNALTAPLVAALHEQLPGHRRRPAAAGSWS